MYAIDINKVYTLVDAYKSGKLGGEKMPEDENPELDKNSKFLNQKYCLFRSEPISSRKELSVLF